MSRRHDRRTGIPRRRHRPFRTPPQRRLDGAADGYRAARPTSRACIGARTARLRIGAYTTIAAIAADKQIAAAYPGIVAAAQGLATPQIRHLATLGGNLAQRSRCWYYRNPHIACLKKGGTDCPARDGNHLYGVAFDLGPCVAPHPSTMAAALLAYDATIITYQRSGLSIPTCSATAPTAPPTMRCCRAR